MLGARIELLVTATVFVAALLLGGGTRGGFLSDAVLQLLAVPVLGVLLWRARNITWSLQARLLLAAAAAMVAVGLLQLVPLPPWIWTSLPGRRQLPGFEAISASALPWRPLSLAPERTWLAVLSALAPVAVLLGTLALSYRERRQLNLVLLAMGGVGIVVGVLQVVQGASSPLRFFDVTSTDVAVGFFANRNHFAALLYVCTLFAAAWAVDNGRRWSAAAAVSQRLDPALLLPVVASLAAIIAFVVAQTLVRSRAGMALAMVSLMGAVAISLLDRRPETRRTSVRLLLAATAAAVMIAVQFSLYRILERFAADPMTDARLPFARNTIAAAWSYMPFGTGLGSFVPVYAMHEPVADALPEAFANHAHDDFLELWLELGVVGFVVVGAVAGWLLWRALAVWRGAWHSGRDMDRALAGAATLVMALLLVHSTVDYPLRTSALMSVFAYTAALLVPPLTSHGEEARRGGASKRSGRERRHPIVETAPPGPAGSRPGERWGKDIEWPEAWRDPQTPPAGGDATPPRRPPRRD